MSGTTVSQLRRAVADMLGWNPSIAITWHRRNDASWLGSHISGESFSVPRSSRMSEIEAIASQIEALGPQPLWDGYQTAYEKDRNLPLATALPVRTVRQVRSEASMGCFFAWLARQRQPDLVVEFGTAFGISGLYWLSGLDENMRGQLLTFEPNERWNTIARQHLLAFSARAIPVLGTFEEKIDRYRQDATIDIGFVDAIHTDEFVTPQVEMLIERLSPGGHIVLDDINFSDDMRACWRRWAHDPRVSASVALDERVGVLEFDPTRH